MGHSLWIGVALKLGVILAPLAIVVSAIASYAPSLTAGTGCEMTPGHLTAAQTGRPRPAGVISVRVDGDEFWCTPTPPPRLNMAELQAQAVQRQR